MAKLHSGEGESIKLLIERERGARLLSGLWGLLAGVREVSGTAGTSTAVLSCIGFLWQTTQLSPSHC